MIGRSATFRRDVQEGYDPLISIAIMKICSNFEKIAGLLDFYGDDPATGSPRGRRMRSPG